MMKECARCGATYADVIDPIPTQCFMSTDGGGTCRGELREIITISGTVHQPGPRPPTRDEIDKVTRAIENLPSDVKRQLDFVGKTIKLRALMSRTEMRHGRVIPDGIAFAMISFASVEDRTAFADLLTVAGGKVSGV